MQETAFGDPASFLYDDAVHDGDLPGGAAEAQQRNLDPNAQRFAKAHAMGTSRAIDSPARAIDCDCGVGLRHLCHLAGGRRPIVRFPL